MLHDPTLQRMENDLRKDRAHQSKLTTDLRNKREEERREIAHLKQKFDRDIERLDRELSGLEHTISNREHDLDRYKTKLMSEHK